MVIENQSRRRLVHVVPILARGGAELQMCRLVEDQVRAGDDLTLVCLRGASELVDELRSHGVTVISAAEGRIRFIRKAFGSARRAEVVHAWMYHGFLISVALRVATRCPHVWSVRRTHPDSPGLTSRTRRIVSLTARLSSRAADGLIFCSQASAIAHRAAGFAAQHETVIYNSVDVPSTDGDVPAPDTPVRRIGFLGRWNADKGADILVRAWRSVSEMHPDVELALAGPGLDTSNSELTHMLQLVGGARRLRLVGSVSEPHRFLSSLDCLVSPSRTEGFPNVVAEAMAQGVPVIATDVGGTREVLADIGELVPAEDPEALAAAMLAFLNDPSALRRRAASGPQRAGSEFSRHETRTRTDALYDRLSKQRSVVG